jgi:predicted hydrocarbon binding protein
MSETTVIVDQNTMSETVPIFGYELLRETLIPEILGEETPKILYWAGKHIARKYPLDSISDLIIFFQQAGWGDLQIVKESKSELIAELSSDIISHRIKSKASTNFQLEAGFLAQQIERQKEVVTETFEHPRKRSSTKVQFTIKWDNKDLT